MQLEKMIEEIATTAATKAAELAHKPTLMTREQIMLEFSLSRHTLSDLINQGVLKYGVHFVTLPGMSHPRWIYRAINDTLLGRPAVKAKES